MTGIRASIAGLGSDLLAVLRTRLELFGLELAEEKTRLLAVLGMAFGAFIFLTLSVLVFSLLIAALYWPTEHRYVALAVLAGVYGLVGLALLMGVRRRLHGAPPFAATVEELSRDADLLGMARDAAQQEAEQREREREDERQRRRGGRTARGARP